MGTRSRADIRRSIHSRIRKKVSGNTERPRLTVFRSAKHIYAQVIDDISGNTLVSASSVEKDFKSKTGGNIDGAAAVGTAVAKKAISAGISEVVYDRGGYIYHGRVKALLDATREAGLNAEESKGDAKPAPKAAAEKKAPKKAAKKAVEEVEVEKGDASEEE